MVFEALIQQGFASSSTELILAVGALVGVLGPLIIAIAGYMKAGRAKDIATAAGQGATLASQKSVEYADRIRSILQAGYNLTPEEQKKVLDAVTPDMDKLREQVKVGTEQIRIISDNLPLEARADSNVTLPRERFNTKPGQSSISV